MTKYRIRKTGTTEWTAEQHVAGGGIAKRGRTAGQPVKESWKTVGYFTRLKYAAAYIFDCAIGDEAATGKQLSEAITAAEARIEAAIDRMEKPDSDFILD